jgi:hypothetical protein
LIDDGGEEEKGDGRTSDDELTLRVMIDLRKLQIMNKLRAFSFYLFFNFN